MFILVVKCMDDVACLVRIFTTTFNLNRDILFVLTYKFT